MKFAAGGGERRDQLVVGQLVQAGIGISALGFHLFEKGEDSVGKFTRKASPRFAIGIVECLVERCQAQGTIFPQQLGESLCREDATIEVDGEIAEFLGCRDVVADGIRHVGHRLEPTGAVLHGDDLVAHGDVAAAGVEEVAPCELLDGLHCGRLEGVGAAAVLEDEKRTERSPLGAAVGKLSIESEAFAVRQRFVETPADVHDVVIGNGMSIGLHCFPLPIHR